MATAAAAEERHEWSSAPAIFTAGCRAGYRRCVLPPLARQNNHRSVHRDKGLDARVKPCFESFFSCSCPDRKPDKLTPTLL
jgi:hypothetical protein